MTFTLTIDAAWLAAALRYASWALYALAALLYLWAARKVWRMPDAPHFASVVPWWIRLPTSAFWPLATVLGWVVIWLERRRARKALP
jgi:hypothetical protein